MNEFRVFCGFVDRLKRARLWSFSGPYFSSFGLNMERYGPEKAPNTHTFHAVVDHH